MSEIHSAINAYILKQCVHQKNIYNEIHSAINAYIRQSMRTFGSPCVHKKNIKRRPKITMKASEKYPRRGKNKNIQKKLLEKEKKKN